MSNALVDHVEKYPGELTIITGDQEYRRNKLRSLQMELRCNEIKIKDYRVCLVTEEEHTIMFVDGSNPDFVRGFLVSGFVNGPGTSAEMYRSLCDRVEIWRTQNKIKEKGLQSFDKGVK